MTQMDWMKVLSDFVQALLLAAAPFVAVDIYKFIKAKAEMAMAEAKAAQPDLVAYLEKFAAIAVKAAEQAHAPELFAEKKAYAFVVVEKLLAAKGFVIDIDAIDAAIEAAVADLPTTH
jgi:hypothetical protein